MKFPKNMDEAEAKARLEQLNNEAATIEAAMKLAGLSVPARPSADASDLVASISATEAHISAMSALVKAAPAKAAQGSQEQKPTAKKLTYSEQILKMNGVTSFAELRAKKAAQKPNSQD